MVRSQALATPQLYVWVLEAALAMNTSRVDKSRNFNGYLFGTMKTSHSLTFHFRTIERARRGRPILQNLHRNYSLIGVCSREAGASGAVVSRGGQDNV
jgi:hypothetical protein